MKTLKQFAKTALVVSFTALSTLALADNSQDLSGFNSAQQAQIRNYVDQAVPQVIMNKPHIIFDAAKKFKEQQQQAQIQQAKTVILSKIDDVLRDKNTPTINPNGKITLVEFFDYQCSVCHMVYPAVNQAIKANPDLRVVYKDLPIFGPASVYAAKGSYAAYMQSPKLYVAYHDALFTQPKMEGQLKDSDVDAIAQKVGLNMAKFHKDINSDEVNSQLQDNGALAQAMQLQGTPAFIIAPSTATSGMSINKLAFIPGGASPQQLNQAVQMVKLASANKAAS